MSGGTRGKAVILTVQVVVMTILRRKVSKHRPALQAIIVKVCEKKRWILFGYACNFAR